MQLPKHPLLLPSECAKLLKVAINCAFVSNPFIECAQRGFPVASLSNAGTGVQPTLQYFCYVLCYVQDLMYSYSSSHPHSCSRGPPYCDNVLNYVASSVLFSRLSVQPLLSKQPSLLFVLYLCPFFRVVSFIKHYVYE